MTKFLNAIWKTLENEVNKAQKKDNNLYLDYECKDGFFKAIEDKYNKVKNKYMKGEVDHLDRHKVAAVVIVTIIESQIIKYREHIAKGKLFIGTEVVAAQVGLSIMNTFLNSRLKELGINRVLSSYYMPPVMSCTTPYFIVFVRNLIYAKEDFILNPLDIAEKLYLLEMISLIKNDINPELLAEGKYEKK